MVSLWRGCTATAIGVPPAIGMVRSSCQVRIRSSLTKTDGEPVGITATRSVLAPKASQPAWASGPTDCQSAGPALGGATVSNWTVPVSRVEP